MAHVTLEEVFVSVSCGRLQSSNFTATADIEGGVVRAEDIDRLMAAARSYAERDGRTLIHLNRIGFRLDGVAGSNDPRGMAAERLAADLHTVAADEAPGAQPPARRRPLLSVGARARRRALRQRHCRHQRGGAAPRRHLHRYRRRHGRRRGVRRGPFHPRGDGPHRRPPHHPRHRARIADATCRGRANQDAVWHNDRRSIGRARGVFLCAHGRGGRRPRPCDEGAACRASSARGSPTSSVWCASGWSRRASVPTPASAWC